LQRIDFLAKSPSSLTKHPYRFITKHHSKFIKSQIPPVKSGFALLKNDITSSEPAFEVADSLQKHVIGIWYIFVGVITQNKADQIHVITITYHSYPFFRFLSISQTSDF